MFACQSIKCVVQTCLQHNFLSTHPIDAALSTKYTRAIGAYRFSKPPRAKVIRRWLRGKHNLLSLMHRQAGTQVRAVAGLTSAAVLAQGGKEQYHSKPLVFCTRAGSPLKHSQKLWLEQRIAIRAAKNCSWYGRLNKPAHVCLTWYRASCLRLQGSNL